LSVASPGASLIAARRGARIVRLLRDSRQ
jgi:hypothetical protein